MRKSTVFYKVFIPFFLLGMLLVGGFGVFIYQNTYDSVKENFVNDKKSLARQIRNNVERKVRTIEYAFSTYGSTRSFGDVFREPLTADEYGIYLEIRRELSYIEMMVMDEKVYDLVSLDGKWGVVNGSLIQLEDSQVAEYREQYMSSKNSLFWQKKADGIEMIIALPMFEQRKYAMGMADISNHSIGKIIENDSNDIISIYGQEELLYTNGDAEAMVELMKTDLDALNYNEPLYIEHNQESLVLLKSEYNNWIYAIQLNHQGLVSPISNLRAALVLVSLILLTAITIFAYIFSERFSRPISKIQQSLDLKTGKFQDSELALVAQSVDKMLGENEYLSASLISQKPQLETLLVLSLFRNRVNKQELDMRLQQFGYDIVKKRYYTGVIQIDSIGTRHGGEEDLLLLAINNIVTELVPEENRLLPIVLNDEMQATLFMMEKDDSEASRKVMHYYEEIQAAVKQFLGISISVGISMKYFDILESKKAVDFAKEALYYRVNTGPASIIFFKEIAPVAGEAALSRYPVELQNQLSDAIRSGESQETIHQLVSQLVDEVFRLNKNTISLEVVLMRLINELVQLGQVLGVESRVFEGVKQLYLKALTTYHPEELKGLLLHQLALPITENAQARTDREFKTLSDKIVHIVQSEYDCELSLELIADRLHYNPNYLSSVFKKEYGENFGDFVQNYRLEIAQKWLKETDRTVKEIAERLQYRNPQNFIRFFKKKLSMTPGEYRKQFR